MYLNIRTDPYLIAVENPLEETLKRIGKYENVGANGIFVPCIVKENEIKKITSSTPLPVNVMCMPDLPSFEILENLGVRRISEGNFVYNHQKATSIELEKIIGTISSDKSFKSLF